MEKAKKTFLARFFEALKNIFKIGGAHCGFWFMGDNKSAENDLLRHFTIV